MVDASPLEALACGCGGIFGWTQGGPETGALYAMNVEAFPYVMSYLLSTTAGRAAIRNAIECGGGRLGLAEMGALLTAVREVGQGTGVIPTESPRRFDGCLALFTLFAQASQARRYNLLRCWQEHKDQDDEHKENKKVYGDIHPPLLDISFALYAASSTIFSGSSWFSARSGMNRGMGKMPASWRASRPASATSS